METYVNEIINLFYHSDADVMNDTELQQWAQEIHEIAFPAFRDAPAGHGFPNKIETRDNLTELCTLIMSLVLLSMPPSTLVSMPCMVLSQMLLSECADLHLPERM